jgi:hypothetical protein
MSKSLRVLEYSIPTQLRSIYKRLCVINRYVARKQLYQNKKGVM